MGNLWSYAAVRKEDYLKGVRCVFDDERRSAIEYLGDFDRAEYFGPVLRRNPADLAAVYGGDVAGAYRAAADRGDECDRVLAPFQLQSVADHLRSLTEKVRGMPFDPLPPFVEPRDEIVHHIRRWEWGTVVDLPDDRVPVYVAEALAADEADFGGPSPRVCEQLSEDEERNFFGEVMGPDGWNPPGRRWYLGTPSNVAILKEVVRSVGHARFHHFHFPWQFGDGNDPRMGFGDVVYRLDGMLGRLRELGEGYVLLQSVG